ncbi:DNA-binding response regulator [Pleomorphomonas koreensis]|uniref:response regulator transcription factor n=1 Tax=Pleomorphomonas koreensis TaxID=257440 RepID=UPI0004132FE0|nr:DNA-binding response regulator [Pleomorphomonas koreensis]
MTPRRDTVLVVDDSPETLSFLTDALEGTGVVVLVATSGLQALAIAGRATPDVILLDAVMPEMDGFATCLRLKAMPSVADVPVIFMTGLSDTEHVVRGLTSGGVDYLTKPINIDELQARIRVHLANARASRGARMALDAAGRHLLAVDASGALAWATPEAGRLIEGLVGEPSAALASMLAAFIAGRGRSGAPATVDFSPGDDTPMLQFSYLGLSDADEYLLRLSRVEASAAPEETLKSAFGLTGREAEVLLWISRGKTNKDIGEILGLSPRTVNKHLEQVFVKLGVENRASAAIKATRLLLDPG